MVMRTIPHLLIAVTLTSPPGEAQREAQRQAQREALRQSFSDNFFGKPFDQAPRQSFQAGHLSASNYFFSIQ